VTRLDRALVLLAAGFLAVFGFLPIANWIPGGAAVPRWADLFGGWWSGTGLVVGIAVVVAVLTRKLSVLPGEGLIPRLVAGWERSSGVWAVSLAVLATAVYLWIAKAVLSGKPLLIDEIVQVYQARIYAAGMLSLPLPHHPEFFTSSLILNLGEKVFSQFPAGGPAMLALGAKFGAEWAVDPLFAGVSVVLFAALVRRIEARPGVALAATILFAFGPFVAFMSGSHMNHVTELTWLLVGMLGLARVVNRSSPRVRDGMLLGLGFGIAGAIRPVDAFAFALPAGAWLLWRTVRGRGWPALIAAGIGVALPIGVILKINAETTGSAVTFGYSALWGKAHDLGFHTTPWGEVHSPAHGLELLNLYFLRLQSYLFQTPVPSLLPAIGALALTRKLAAFDRYLLAAAALLTGCYFAYWHDGFYLGPRFMLPLAPMLALWTARLIPLVRERFASRSVARGLGVGAVTAAVIAVAVSIPIQVREYQNGMLTMRWDADGAAERAGVRHALVLVRESWGAQLVARMWAAGVPPSESEHIYRKADACAMEHTLTRIEGEGLRGPAAVAQLTPLLADSGRLVTSPFTTDPTNRMLQGAAYSPDCIARLKEDRLGYTLFSPLLLAGRGEAVYARDLHGRDSLLLADYPGRSVYLLRPATTAVGAAPQFYPLNRDSLLAAWRRGE
jgi:hypothetical protein